jgi:protein TonB
MRVLLVDHDSEALETITRAIRGVLELDCVTSKGDALLLLRQNTYDVLIACERCVDGSGLDLLGRTTRTAVPLKRVFAAAPERLQLLGPRLAPFKVQRTINYPIDLEELWLAIAQVTGDGNDETDGTIERVVLDERGIPSTGSVPRAPIPPRSSPLSVSPAPVAVAAASRGAAARAAQPAQEPPARAPAPRSVQTTAAPLTVARAPAPPRTTSDTGRMRAAQLPPAAHVPPAPPIQPLAPMTAAGPPDFPAWEPEKTADDFAQISAQARFGVQQDAGRRGRHRVAAATGIAVVVGGAILTLLYRFYDPESRAREAAIAAEVTRMAEQQKVTDQLTLIEIGIENAIMNNDLDTARRELAQLVEQSPEHPRREFLQASIDRAAELARLSAQDAEAQRPAQAAMLPAGGTRSAERPRATTRAPERSDRVATRTANRPAASRNREPAAAAPRVYGAPLGDVPRQTLPLDAPINSPPVTTVARADNAFSGRTLEAGDPPLGRAPPPAPPPTQQPAQPAGSLPSATSGAGSAVAPMPNVAPSASQAGSAAIDVVPAKIVKRVTPVAPADIPRKAKGYVVVRFDIGTDGRVGNLEVVESQPQGMFDAAARDAVRKWIYEPRKENGVAVNSTAKARLVFDAAD